MPQLLESIVRQIDAVALIDIGIVALLIYGLFSLIRGTRAVSLVIGVTVLFAVYAIAVLAGGAGALLLTPVAATVGASGGVFGILGAALFLERRGINVVGGFAFAVVAFNIVFSFAIPNVSIGGHLGGLVGGLAAAFVLSGFGRGHAAYQRIRPLEAVGLAALVFVALALAYARVRGLA